MAMLLREALGDSLRRVRTHQGRTLREVSTAARVSLGYLSEVERGQKEASSELLAAICEALDVEIADLLLDIGTAMRPAPALASEGLEAAVIGAEAVAADLVGADVVSADVVGAGSEAVGADSLPSTKVVIPAPGADRRPTALAAA